MKPAAFAKAASYFTYLVGFLFFKEKTLFRSLKRTRGKKLQLVGLEKKTHNYPWARRATKGQPHINRNYSMQKTRRGPLKKTED